MKKLLTVTFTFLSILFFIQCGGNFGKNAPEDPDIKSGSIEPGDVQITGFIHNRSKYPNTKELRIEIPNISGDAFSIVTPIDENGKFHFIFKLNQPQDIRMEPYLDFLYVYPNDSLHVELNFEDLTKVQLSGGKTAQICREFENYFAHTFYRNSDYWIGTATELNSSIEEIRRILDDKKALFYERRNSLLQTTQLHDDVLFLTEAMIELDYYSALVHIVLRRHYEKRMINPEELMDEMDKKTIGYFTKGLYSDSHFKFIGGMCMLKALHTPPDKKTSLPLQLLQFSNDTIRNFALARQASMALKVKDLDNFETIYSLIDYPYLSSRLMREYQMEWEKMNNPQAISDAITGEFTDMQQNTLSKRNLLSEMIAKHKGKVQVIDIWSTWCGPCLAEFPHYRSLIDDYKDKEVAFSFICTGKNEQQSHKILQEHQLLDVSNHFCSEEELQFLRKTFSPLGYPYGILVNKKGVIVDYGTHVRPETMRKKLDVLLEQDKLVK